ncbi:MAG TPA: spore coat U domain-containing protein [Nitrospira sp.]|nr:spore coat U domain-containing protein [Nitrospira sp.]
MMMNRATTQLLALTVSAIAVFCLSTPSAQAQVASSAFGVSASVIASCTITTTNMGFGNYDPVSANATTPATTNGTVTIACTRGTNPRIDLNAGSNSANAVGTTRAMAAAGPSYLSYELYQDGTYTTVWGVNTNGFSPGVVTTLAATPYTIYGRIPAGQDRAVGNYTDTITATVNF